MDQTKKHIYRSALGASTPVPPDSMLRACGYRVVWVGKINGVFCNGGLSTSDNIEAGGVGEAPWWLSACGTLPDMGQTAVALSTVYFSDTGNKSPILQPSYTNLVIWG